MKRTLFTLVLTLSAWPALALTTAPTSTPGAPEKTVPYVVVSGDTLSGIAQKYLLAVSDFHAVQTLNHIPRPRHMRPGSTLNLPYDRLRGTLEVGKIITFSGEAFISDHGAPVRVTLGAEVHEGNVLTTQANAFMTLELSDGTHLTLPSQSSVTVARLRQIKLTQGREVEFQITDGRSQAAVTKLRRPTDHFLIRTPVSVAAVRGTQFRVGYQAKLNWGSVEVIDGLVGVGGTGAAATVGLPASTGVAVVAGAMSAPQVLLANPVVIKPGRLQSDPQLSFALDPMAAAQTYRGQLANDAGFLDLFAETTSAGPQLSFAGLADGTYFLRVSAVSAEGLEGMAKVYTFQRQLFTPGGPPAASLVGKQKRYGFRWFGGSDTAAFRFQLAHDQGFKDVVIDESGLKTKQLILTDLPIGNYWWRVIVADVRDAQVHFDSGSAQSFEVAGG